MVQKQLYRLEFSPSELAPLLESQTMTEQEDPIQAFLKMPALFENPMEAQREDVAVSLAEVQDDIADAERQGQDESSTTNPEHETKDRHAFAIVYFNPQTHKSEVLVSRSEIHLKDPARQVVEEASGKASAYPIYSYIATPIMETRVEPYLLERILNEREYDTPPPFGGAARIKTSTVVAVRMAPVPEKQRSAVVEALQRKEKVEARVEKEIVSLQAAVAMLQQDPKPRIAVQRLGPLTRVRFLALLKEKKISPALLMMLLNKDVIFLKAIKKKLQLLSTAELIQLLMAMRELKKPGK